MDINPSNDPNQKVDYIKYEDLKEFPDSTDLNKISLFIISTLLNLNSNWLTQFNCFTDLRRIRKFHHDKFFPVFGKIYKVFPEYLNSIRSNIAKGSLLLVTEIFSFYDFELFSDLIKTLLPMVLLKSSSDKKFLKDEALAAWNNAGCNMFYNETIEVLLEETGNKSSIVSENSFNTLISLINNFDQTLLENIGDWDIIFKKIVDLYNLKREIYVKKTLKIISTLSQKLGED